MKIFQYFTFWGIIFQGLYYSGYLRKYQESLLVILCLISFGGFFITYIYPKYFILDIGLPNNLKIKIRGALCKYYDLAVHHVPLILFIYFYNSKLKKDNLILAFSLIIIYLVLYNPVKIYYLH